MSDIFLSKEDLSAKLAIAEAKNAALEQELGRYRRKEEFDKRFNEAKEFLGANGFSIYRSDISTVDLAKQTLEASGYQVVRKNIIAETMAKTYTEPKFGPSVRKWTDFDMQNFALWVFQNYSGEVNPEEAFKKWRFNTF